MKFLLFLVVILFGVGVWRSSRKNKSIDPPTKSKSAVTEASIDTVSCQHCGVHVAKDDACMGRAGPYCSIKHRAAAEP